MKIMTWLLVLGALFIMLVFGSIGYDNYREHNKEDASERAKIVAYESTRSGWSDRYGSGKYYADGSERPLSEWGKKTVKGEDDLFWITMLLTAIMFFGCSSRTIPGVMLGGILGIIILILIAIQGC